MKQTRSGVSCRNGKYLTQTEDRTPAQVRLTRACLVPIQGRIQPAQPGTMLTVPRDLARLVVELGKAEFVL